MKLNKQTGAMIALAILSIAVIVYFFVKKKKANSGGSSSSSPLNSGGGFTKLDSYPTTGGSGSSSGGGGSSSSGGGGSSSSGGGGSAAGVRAAGVRAEDFPLKKGSKGPSVKALQEFLLGNGFDMGSAGADGSFGGKTEAAVQLFFGEKSLSYENWNNRQWQMKAGNVSTRAKNIHRAKGFLNDNEDIVFQNLSNLSASEKKELESVFVNMFSVNMWDYLASFLSQLEMIEAQTAYNGTKASAGSTSATISLEDRARKINKAKGGYFANDDENAIYEALTGLTSKEKTQLEATFLKLYQIGLWSYLLTFLDEAEIVKAKKFYEGK